MGLSITGNKDSEWFSVCAPFSSHVGFLEAQAILEQPRACPLADARAAPSVHLPYLAAGTSVVLVAADRLKSKGKKRCLKQKAFSREGTIALKVLLPA